MKANGVIIVLLFYKNSNKNVIVADIYNIVRNTVRETGGVHHKKGAGRPTLCTSEVIDDVEEFMENNPSTSSRHLSQEVGLSVGTSHRIVKKSSIFFGTHFMPIELLPADINRRIPYW